MNIISIASDHAGYNLKEMIKTYFDQQKILYKDFGTNSENSVDYPDYAKFVTDSIEQNQSQKGILICYSGIGMSIAANRNKKVRAALCYDEELVTMAKKHNDANVLVLGAGYINQETAIKMIDIFLNIKFEGERHQKRIDKL